MKPTATVRNHRTWPSLALGLLATLALAVPAYAQGDDAATEESLSAVGEARDAAVGRIEAAQDAIDVACVGLAFEACLTNHAAPQLRIVADELDAYADRLEELGVPSAFSEDVTIQVAAHRAESDLVEASVAAASAADIVALDAVFVERIEAATELAEQLDPTWARAAYLTSFGSSSDILAFAGDLTAEERAYLDATRQTDQAAASDFACFSQALSRTYGSTGDVLQALSDCGAGSALPKVEAAARELQPPERFADEHAWWLGVLTERSRLDGLIGEAAVEGDVTKFLANNERLNLAHLPLPDLDPAFLRGYPGPGSALDPAEPLASTEYGRALFRTLMDYEATNPLIRAMSALDISFVPREEALPAVTELAPELTALDTELRAALAALEPPSELAADHAVITDFFDRYSQGLDDFINAAEAGDVEGTFAVQNAADAVYCDASAELSETILPVAEVFFGPDAPVCR